MGQLTVPTLLTGLLLLSAVGVGYTWGDVSLSNLRAVLPGSGCNIKGNVSVATGERIYHVRGQKYYRETVITLSRGERWFCSETEAQQAGWRKARN